MHFTRGGQQNESPVVKFNLASSVYCVTWQLYESCSSSFPSSVIFPEDDRLRAKTCWSYVQC